MSNITKYITYLSLFISPQLAHASSSEYILGLTTSPISIIALLVFALAYIIVFFEEYLHIQKSKPMILASGIIWSLVAFAAYQVDASDIAVKVINSNLLEYIQLALFLLVAMTYINAMEERQVFAGLRSWLVSKKFSYHQLFIITGILAFFISPIADNLTTALFMCAVLMAVGKDSPRLITLGCINIVVAANAGGAFSPFGDITTLMVWQAGALEFTTFFKLFVPAVVNFLVPALIMLPAVPKGSPVERKEHVVLKPGALMVVILFFASMTTSVLMHYYLHLPAVIGMMTGLGFLQLYGYYLNSIEKKKYPHTAYRHADYEFDIFKRIAAVEWDTLLFFYGVVLCVGGLGALGYLATMSSLLYDQLGAALGLSGAFAQTPANVMIGIMSAVVDNIPIMFAVLAMEPLMSEGQWLLVTLTAGVGGSMLSIGSAAGVGLMGQARGFYTFFSHLKWSWAVALGYFASIAVHMAINYATFFSVT